MADARRNEETFMFDRAAETMARDELEALQLHRLKQTIARAYAQVPPFRRKLDAAGARPEALKTLADIARFPFTVKADLRDNYPFGLFAVPREKVLRLHASSGTTGKPTVVGYTRADLDLWSDVMARSLACMGGKPGDIFHNAYGYGLFTGGLGFHYGAERLGLTTVPVSGGATDASGPNLGATPCATSSRRNSPSRRWTFMGSPRSSGRASPANAIRRSTACTFGRIISSAR